MTVKRGDVSTAKNITINYHWHYMYSKLYYARHKIFKHKLALNTTCNLLNTFMIYFGTI